MKRNIIFRGKSLIDGKWVYGDLEVRRATGYHYIHEYNANGTYRGQRWIDPKTVGQYTGVDTCNGVMVFEGDVLDVTVFDCHDNDTQYTVVVKYCGSEFVGESRAKSAMWNLYWLLNQDSEAQVVDNIYDKYQRANIVCNDITDRFLPNYLQETKVFEYVSEYTTVKVGVGYDKNGNIDWATIYTIETKEECRRQGHASFMIEYLMDYEGYHDLQSSVTLNDAATALMDKYNIEILNEKKHGNICY